MGLMYCFCAQKIAYLLIGYHGCKAVSTLKEGSFPEGYWEPQ